MSGRAAAILTVLAAVVIVFVVADYLDELWVAAWAGVAVLVAVAGIWTALGWSRDQHRAFRARRWRR